MKVTPVAQPIVQANTQPSAPAQDSRARAIAMLSNPTGIENANQVQPEEMSAIVPHTRQSDTTVEDTAATAEAVGITQEDPPKDAPKDPLASQYAVLARKEQQLRMQAKKQQQALQSEKAAFQAEKAEMQAKLQAYEQGYISKDKLKQSTYEALSEAGVSYDEIVQQYIDSTQNPVDPRLNSHISKLEAKIAQLEAANEQAQNNQKTAQQQQYDAAVKQIRSDAKTLVKNDPNFESIRAEGTVRDVVELITKTFNEDGVLLTVEEAAQKVEDFLTEKNLKRAQLKKIQERIGKSSGNQAKTQAAAPANQKQSQPMKTLTNATSSTRQLSAKERAVLAFKGELK